VREFEDDGESGLAKKGILCSHRGEYALSTEFVVRKHLQCTAEKSQKSNSAARPRSGVRPSSASIVQNVVACRTAIA
jgi:hypothetical protein